MIYVYQINGAWTVNRHTAPEGVEHITLRRMIPTPVKPGYDAKLNADLKTGKVWFDLVENIEGIRARKIAEIEAYDKSDAVNRFTIGGLSMWLSREERASLKIRFEAEKAAGKTDTVLWFDGVRIPIPDIDAGLGMLVKLELYASECYDITQQHIAAVKQLKTADEINAYDHAVGYPDKLEF